MTTTMTTIETTRTPTSQEDRVYYDRPVIKSYKELQFATPDERHQVATEVFKFLRNPDHINDWYSVFNKRDTKMIDDMLNDKEKYYIDDDFIKHIHWACYRPNTFSMTRIKYFLFANK